MKVSVAIRVSAENRWHTQVKVISEEFNKGTPFKGEGRIQGCLFLRKGRGGSSYQMLLGWICGGRFGAKESWVNLSF